MVPLGQCLFPSTKRAAISHMAASTLLLKRILFERLTSNNNFVTSTSKLCILTEYITNHGVLFFIQNHRSGKVFFLPCSRSLRSDPSSSFDIILILTHQHSPRHLIVYFDIQNFHCTFVFQFDGYLNWYPEAALNQRTWLLSDKFECSIWLVKLQS